MKTTQIFLLILLIICFSFPALYSKQNKIDSLTNVLKSAIEDTNKVNNLLDLAWEKKRNNPDTSIIIGTQALELAEKIKWQFGIALSHRYLGTFFQIKGDYPPALEHFSKAIAICEELEKSGTIPKDQVLSLKSKIFGSNGNVYGLQGDYLRALDNYLKALKIAEALGEKKSIAAFLANIGIVHNQQGDHEKALEYYFKGLKMAEEIGDKSGIAADLGNIANVYYSQGDSADRKGNKAFAIAEKYPKALEYYFKALKVAEEMDDKNRIAVQLGNIAAVYDASNQFPKALEYLQKSLKLNEELGRKNGIAKSHSGLGLLYTKTGKYKEAEIELKKAIALNEELGATDNLQESEQAISELYEATGRKDLALLHYKKSVVLKDTMFNAEKNEQITRKEMNYEFEKKETAAKAEQDKKDAIAQQQIQKQKIIRNSLIGGFLIVLIFAFVFFTQRNRISKEKQRSEALLLNILPSEVAEELKMKGESEAKQFDDVTVLFTDFVNFTGASEKLTPKELVGEIHQCFKAFDDIIGRNGLEKIKTIGDAYLAVCGLPNSDGQHAAKTVTAAQEILKFMNERKNVPGNKDGIGEVRIGINSGAVVAGIVGVKKFAYDIWGDTVNIAARMEQNCEAGRINISGSTYDLVKDEFNCIHRGKVAAKNKGEIDMYFVETKL